MSDNIENNDRQGQMYVVCSDVFKNSPYFMYGVADGAVVVADFTVRELEEAKNGKGIEAKNAAKALEEIHYIAENSEFSSNSRSRMETVLPNGGKLILMATGSERETVESLMRLYGTLSCNSEDAVLISGKLSLRIKLGSEGIKTLPYRDETQDEIVEDYSGRAIFDVGDEFINRFYKDGEIEPEDVSCFEENQFVMLRSEADPKHTALGYYRCGSIYRLSSEKTYPYGVKPMNVGQRYAIEALMLPVEIAPLVILKGPAGTAKTHLALAAGLQKVVNSNEFIRILVSRPNVKFDDDIGYLKGGEVEKIEPLIRPIMDNLELLTRTKNAGTKDGINLPGNYAKELFDRGIIKAEAMAYMRGRSIANTWIILDEAQNMTPSQAYGIVTRAGIGSKIILCGDPEQCDVPSLNAANCGLTYISEHMKGSPNCWQVSFSKNECVRSELAKDALARMFL